MSENDDIPTFEGLFISGHVMKRGSDVDDFEVDTDEDD